MRRRSWAWPMVAVLIVVLAGCRTTSPGDSASVVSIDIDQGDLTLKVGTSTTLTVTVVVTGGASDTVSWSTEGASIATVSGGGLVTGIAPGTTVVRATSTADDTRNASVNLTVIPNAEDPGVAIAIVPSAVDLAPLEETTFTATVTGASDTSVSWSATCGAINGTDNTISYTAPATTGACVLTATSNADPTKSANADVTVTSAAPVAVIVEPATTTMIVNETESFTATVTGAVDATVSWTATCGSIDGTGNTISYTAPATTGACVLTATSNADPAKSAAANVTVTLAPTVSVTVEPATATVSVNESASFTATVTGASETSVTWSATCGSVDGSANTIVYTGPAAAGACVLTATSNADPTKSAAANVTIESGAGGFESAPAYVDISNVDLSTTSGGIRRVNFDISWPESWRGPDRPTWVTAQDNWDAAWVFVKYRVSGGPWQHATLASIGHVAPAGAIVDVTNDGMGAFVYRASSGYGTFAANGVGLRWDYVADGVAPDASVELRPFAIEMVYVPRASFSLGSFNTSIGGFRAGGTANTPFVVGSQSSIGLGDASGQLTWTTESSSGSPAGSTNARFPTGYVAFYLMKHELTQGQYVDFLNTLVQEQLDARRLMFVPDGLARYAITGDEVGSFVTALPFVPVAFVNWADGAAFTDWAGLRPMTELEFEKAARGPLAPVANEYAWGSTSITRATDLVNAGTITERPAPTNANATYGEPLSFPENVQGPVRAGSFAVPGRSRRDAGAGYYGALELSGNLRERAVTVGNAEGRAFTGTHGDGSLDPVGEANVASWPGPTEVGAGFRGGFWYSDVGEHRVSDRRYAAFASAGRVDYYGWRAARSAPVDFPACPCSVR